MRGHGIEKKSLEGGEGAAKSFAAAQDVWLLYILLFFAHISPVFYSAISGLSYRKEIVLSLRVLTQILRTELF